MLTDDTQSDVTGECETKYIVNSDVNTTSDGPPTILVTTVRNFDKCLKKPLYVEGFLAGIYGDRNEKVYIRWIIYTVCHQSSLHIEVVKTAEICDFITYLYNRYRRLYTFISPLSS